MKTLIRFVGYLTIVLLLMLGCEKTTKNSNGNGNGDINCIYIADGGNNRIIQMDDMTGSGWETFGSEGNGVGEFIWSSDIAIGPDKKIYIVDSGNNRIVRIDDMNGAGWITYGTEGNGVGEFNFSWDGSSTVVGTDGKIYIVDNMNNRIVRINDMTGDGWITYGNEGSGEGELDWPTGIEIGIDNKIYIADYCNDRIIKIDNMIGQGWISFGFNSPTDVAVAPNGKIYMISEGGVIGCIDDMTGTGWLSYGEDEELFNEPCGIDIGADNKIYVLDSDNDRIVRIDDMTGSGWIDYGSGGSGEGEFYMPMGIVVIQ